MILINPYIYTSTVSAALWTPEEIAEEGILWIQPSDSSTVTESAGSVSLVQDKFKNVTLVAQADSGKQPSLLTANLNGLDVLDFNGSSDTLPLPELFTSGQDVNVFGVLKFDTNLEKYVISSPSFIHIWLSRKSSRFSYYRAGWRNSTTNLTDSVWHVLDHILVDPSGESFVNGTSDSTGLTYTQAAFATGGAIGSSATETSHFLGQMAEVIVTNNLSSDNIDRVRGYLAHRYGLQGNLPVAHPYKAVAPTHISYDFDTTFDFVLSGNNTTGWTIDGSNWADILRDDVKGLDATPNTTDSIQKNPEDDFFCAKGGDRELSLPANIHPGTGVFTHILVVDWENQLGSREISFQNNGGANSWRLKSTGIEFRESGETTEDLAYSLTIGDVYFIAIQRRSDNKYYAGICNSSIGTLTTSVDWIGPTTMGGGTDVGYPSTFRIPENAKVYKVAFVDTQLSEAEIGRIYKDAQLEFPDL